MNTHGFLNRGCISIYSNQSYSLIEVSNKMARPIELGLILEGKDAEVFWENEKNPKVTSDQIDMFKEAIRIRKNNFKI
jgi:hypothetical protein